MKRANIKDVRIVVSDGEIHIRDVEELHIKNNKVKIKFKGWPKTYHIDEVYVDAGELYIVSQEVSE